MHGNIGNNNSGKPVVQMTLSGEVIKIYKSGTEAAKAVGGSVTGISFACNQIQQTAKGFKWKHQ